MKLALIPARSGSKRFPNKNIKLLNGHPLIAFSIVSAIRSEIFDKIVVCTDSREYANIAQTYGAEVPYLRILIMHVVHLLILSGLVKHFSFLRKNIQKLTFFNFAAYKSM